VANCFLCSVDLYNRELAPTSRNYHFVGTDLQFLSILFSTFSTPIFSFIIFSVSSPFFLSYIIVFSSFRFLPDAEMQHIGSFYCCKTSSEIERGATENARLENPAPSKIQGWKTRDRKTRHQLAGVENEGINCMDSQWDNFCNLLK